MYKVGRSICERLRGCSASVVDLWGKQQSPHMYVLRTYFWNRWRHKYLTSLHEFHRTTGTISKLSRSESKFWFMTMVPEQPGSC